MGDLVADTGVRSRKGRSQDAHLETGLPPAGIGAYLTMTLLALFAMGPIVLFIVNSLKTRPELADNPLGLPSQPQWSNFINAWVDANLSAGFLNSALIVGGTVLGTCLVASGAAYAMARLQVPGSSGLLTYLIVTSSLPTQLFITPIFYLWVSAHLYNTQIGLIIIYIGLFSPFATLLLRSFLITIPVEFEEAARVDGASDWQVLRHVVLPQSWSGIVSIALVSGLAAYNEFLFAVTFLQDPEKLPVSIALYSFRSSSYLQNQVLINAAGVLMMVPVLIFFLLMQRRLVAGLTAGGLVG